MSSAVDILAERVVGAVELIGSLRTKVQSLERDLLATRARPLDHSPLAPSPAPDPSLVEELERLRAERAEVRERIRALLREIDRVSW